MRTQTQHLPTWCIDKCKHFATITNGNRIRRASIKMRILFRKCASEPNSTASIFNAQLSLARFRIGRDIECMCCVRTLLLPTNDIGNEHEDG